MLPSFIHSIGDNNSTSHFEEKSIQALIAVVKSKKPRG
jgi:hypothetical protein